VWESRIKKPELTNEMKEYILNQTLDYKLMTKEEIDELTYESRNGNETLDAVYDYYLQQRSLRNK